MPQTEILKRSRALQEKFHDYFQPTPLMEAKSGLFLKCEMGLPTGSFKIRPALSGIFSLTSEERARGVVASSSGNFAQAVAFAAKRLNCSAQIVMTDSTSPYKINKTKDLGAEVILCASSFESRWETTFRVQRETGRALLHPYDSEATLAGNATLGLELLNQISDSFTVFVPVSGGGLIGGVALSIKKLRPACRIVGVQPVSNPSMKTSLKEGRPTRVQTRPSLADALVAAEPGKLGFQIAQESVDDILLISDDEILGAMHWLSSEHQLKVEPAGAIAVAAALRADSHKLGRDPVVCILSGGNVSDERYNELLSR